MHFCINAFTNIFISSKGKLYFPVISQGEAAHMISHHINATNGEIWASSSSLWFQNALDLKNSGRRSCSLLMDFSAERIAYQRRSTSMFQWKRFKLRRNSLMTTTLRRMAKQQDRTTSISFRLISMKSERGKDHSQCTMLTRSKEATLRWEEVSFLEHVSLAEKITLAKQ